MTVKVAKCPRCEGTGKREGLLTKRCSTCWGSGEIFGEYGELYNPTPILSEAKVHQIQQLYSYGHDVLFIAAKLGLGVKAVKDSLQA